MLFNPPPAARSVYLVTDESGLRAVEGILRSLDRATVGQALIEVPLEADIRDLDGPEAVGSPGPIPAPTSSPSGSRLWLPEFAVT